jgi:hypothetical protein
LHPRLPQAADDDVALFAARQRNSEVVSGGANTHSHARNKCAQKQDRFSGLLREIEQPVGIRGRVVFTEQDLERDDEPALPIPGAGIGLSQTCQ